MLSAKCYLRIAAVVALLTTSALAREWHITRFYSNMQVSQDGTMTVSEHLVVQFEGEYHGIYRDIPIQYPGPHGSNYTLFLKIPDVIGDAGKKLK